MILAGNAAPYYSDVKIDKGHFPDYRSACFSFGMRSHNCTRPTDRIILKILALMNSIKRRHKLIFLCNELYLIPLVKLNYSICVVLCN